MPADATGPRQPEQPRPCAVCGGPLHRSHVAYLGRSQEATVYRCQSCGVTEQGPPRDRHDRQERQAARAREQGGRRRERRPLPNDGAPDNPVIGEDMARLLRERFGGE